LTVINNEPDAAAVADQPKRTIETDHFPLSPRVRTPQAIDKIEPPRVREPLPPPKTYAPPRAGRRRR